MVLVSRASALDRCVELRSIGVLFRAGLLSSEDRSTLKTSDSVDEEPSELILTIMINAINVELLISIR